MVPFSSSFSFFLFSRIRKKERAREKAVESKKSRVGYNSLLRARLPRGSFDSLQIDLSERMSREKEEEGEKEDEGE